MKNVGIITELRHNTTNYGNVLQAYALNKFINNIDSLNAETLIIEGKQQKKITKKNILFWSAKLAYSSYRKIFNKHKNNKECNLQKRQFLFDKFIQKNINTSTEIMDWKKICNSKYDIFIVGSDIVWIQGKGFVDKIKFLDFNNKKNIKKMSYAASFGNNFIPKENQTAIKEMLKSFSFISVREKTSIELLTNIGVENVKHVCDPTLLLSDNEWSQIEIKPKLPTNKYVFVYLLGNNLNQRNFIAEFAKKKNLKVVSIPNASGTLCDSDVDFGDFQINDCSPENWIWLIHHAEYIFTDSFHGTIFSTIFEKKFIVMSRENKININNRMLDYLTNVNQLDKYLTNTTADAIDELKWNYNAINKNIFKMINNSSQMLKEQLNNNEMED